DRSRSTFPIPRAACSACRAPRESRRAELPLPALTSSPRAARELRCLDDLARLQATRADAQVRAPPADHRVHPLQVGQRPLLGLVVGVAHLVPREWSLAAQFALERHLPSAPNFFGHEKNGGTYPGISRCQVAE